MSESESILSRILYEISELRDSFLELTSDQSLRRAAYPENEWIKNGGSRSDYYMVLMRDVQEVMVRPMGILSPSSEGVKQSQEARKKNIEQYWCEVESHQYYEQLNENPLFREAFRLFKEKEKEVEFADFRFCNLVAQHIGWQMICNEMDYKPPSLNSKGLTKAKGHIKKLQEDIDNGLSLNNFNTQLDLENCLKQLVIEIDQTPRKERETPTRQNSRTLKNFTKGYLQYFNAASPIILMELASMLEWEDIHEKTVEAIISEARKELSL